jgi:hypothetical protein
LKYRITLHSGFHAPDDAIELLWSHLEQLRHDVRFMKIGPELRATWGELPTSYEVREGRSEEGRLLVLDLIREVCERTEDCKSDWFAVAPLD